MNIIDILARHEAWIKGEGGARADLSRADLSGAYLTGADLRWASLSEASLTRANLRWASLSEASLTGANLTGADLTGANLTRANLTGANLDMSSGIPFHCGGAAFKGDDRLAAQMIYHFARGDWSGCSGGVQEAVEAIRSMAITDLFCEYRSDIT